MKRIKFFSVVFFIAALIFAATPTIAQEQTAEASANSPVTVLEKQIANAKAYVQAIAEKGSATVEDFEILEDIGDYPNANYVKSMRDLNLNTGGVAKDSAFFSAMNSAVDTYFDGWQYGDSSTNDIARFFKRYTDKDVKIIPYKNWLFHTVQFIVAFLLAWIITALIIAAINKALTRRCGSNATLNPGNVEIDFGIAVLIFVIIFTFSNGITGWLLTKWF